MKIAVLIKQTPDTAELPKIGADEVISGQINATTVINPWDEFAVEEAIQFSERFDADAVAMALGSADSVDALKHALAMGVGSASLIECDPSQMDDWGTAATLAAAINNEGGIDIVLTGKQSVDGNSGSVFVGVARKMGAPLLVNVSKIIDATDGTIRVERLIEGSTETVSAPLPVVISVAKEINEPRYPSFMGIRKANRAEIPNVSSDSLGVPASTPASAWTNIRKPVVAKSDVKMIEGDSVAAKAANLVDALMAEKVI